jgi:hypothetical protein
MVGFFPLRIALLKNKPLQFSFSEKKNLILAANLQLNFKFKQFFNTLHLFYENLDETFIGINKKNIVKTFLQQVRNNYFLKAMTNIRRFTFSKPS